MTTWDERERGFEAAFAHDEDMQFRAVAHRNHQIGLWAAAQLGMSTADAEAYANRVTAAGVAKAGDDVIIDMIEADLRTGNVMVSRDAVGLRLTQLMGEALAQRGVAPSI